MRDSPNDYYFLFYGNPGICINNCTIPDGLAWTTAGVQYDTYTMGCYQSAEGSLSGFQLQEKEIINQDEALSGLVRGGGHGSITAGPDGQLWCFYTVNVGYEGDMESFIGADLAMIDEEGNLVVPNLSEYPQYVPGVKEEAALGNNVDCDIISVRSSYAISSYSEGRHPIYMLRADICKRGRLHKFLVRRKTQLGFSHYAPPAAVDHSS